MKLKKKICKDCNKPTYLFSRGRCRVCADKEKRRSKPSMAAFFDEIIAERPPVSFLSGKSLSYYLSNKSFRYSCCAHVLSRKHFPHLALVKENVVLITPEEHQLLDMGTIEQRERYAGENGCEWNKIEQIKEKLLCRK